MSDKLKEIDSNEIELPETTFSRNIESRVFQAIVFQCLSKIEGISLVSGSLIDSLLGRDAHERYSGVLIEQEDKKHSVSIKIEVNIKYGLSIPEKSEEIQSKIIEEISKLTGLHVSCVHVIFKNLIFEVSEDEMEEEGEDKVLASSQEEEYEGF